MQCWLRARPKQHRRCCCYRHMADYELPPRETLSRSKTPRADLDFFFVEDSYKTSKEHNVRAATFTPRP